MAFFQTDIDPIYLREEHREISPIMSIQTQAKSVQTNTPLVTTKLLFHQLFKGSVNESSQSITSDPMNRLVSFHL